MTQSRFSRTRLAALATLGVVLTALNPLTARAQYVFTNVVDTNTAAPAWGVFEAFSDASISGNTIAFKGYYSDGINYDSGIFTGSAGALTTIASRESTAAPGGGTFDNFSSVSISGSTVAFRGDYSGGTGRTGIFTGSGGALTTIASDGAGNNAVPGGGIFNSLNSPSISGSTVAFLSGYSGGIGTRGIFTGSGGAITTIVTNADTVPGGGSWGGFVSLSISGSTVAFEGYYSGDTGSSSGIFLSSGGSLTKLIGEGDTLFGSTVDSFRFESTGLDGTSLAFQYSLADGRSGIALATLASSSSAPEPGTLALLSLGGALVMVQRRRKLCMPL